MWACGSPATGASIRVGLARRPVLNMQRRPGGVMAEADPANRTRIGPVLPARPFPGPAQDLRHVPHGPVIGPVDRVPDRGTFGWGGRELGGQRD